MRKIFLGVVLACCCAAAFLGRTGPSKPMNKVDGKPLPGHAEAIALYDADHRRSAFGYAMWARCGVIVAIWMSRACRMANTLQVSSVSKTPWANYDATAPTAYITLPRSRRCSRCEHGTHCSNVRYGMQSDLNCCIELALMFAMPNRTCCLSPSCADDRCPTV
jgi:hypothetical protein